MRQLKLSTGRILDIPENFIYGIAHPNGTGVILVSATNDDSFGQTAICVVYDGDVQDLPLGCTSKIVELDFLVDGESMFFAHASGTLVTGRKLLNEAEIVQLST